MDTVERVGAFIFSTIGGGILCGIVCLGMWAIPHYGSGPCAWRGGYDRFEADYVVCANGERRAYDPKTKTFYDVKIMLSPGDGQ